AAPSPIAAYARQRGYPDPFQSLPALCRRRRVPAARVPDLAGPEAVAAVVEAGVGLLVNAGGGLFREPLIGACPAGILNAHMGPLPRVRGMNALEWSLLEGLPPTVTLHFVAAGIDTGDILDCQPIPVEPGDTIAVLRQRYVPVAVELVAAQLAAVAAGTAARQTQRAVEGRQYFALHPQLRRLAEARLRGRGPDPERAAAV
ncbi:MAG: formyltransferase family protein, partial [Gemmatimonadota bacterium]